MILWIASQDRVPPLSKWQQVLFWFKAKATCWFKARPTMIDGGGQTDLVARILLVGSSMFCIYNALCNNKKKTVITVRLPLWPLFYFAIYNNGDFRLDLHTPHWLTVQSCMFTFIQRENKRERGKLLGPMLCSSAILSTGLEWKKNIL